MIVSNDKRRDQRFKLDEKTHVEDPFLDQLKAQGWEVLRLQQVQEPAESTRDNFGQVVLQPKLEEALRKINPFLEDDQVHEVVRRITTFPSTTLLENNQYVLNLLLENTTVAENRQAGEQSPTVRYVDFENVANNSFLAISQFKLRIPGTEHHIVPDIVLFLNGLPVVVVECKSPRVQEPIPEAIDQLLRYSQQRGASGEGNQELFYYNQFQVATCRSEAKFGTISTHIEKYWFRWSDPYPLNLDELPSRGTSPNNQQRLVAGMLTKRNLLDLIQCYTIFAPDDKGHTIKIVARYQQFRAVKLAIKRLLEGRNARQRSGIIWHTQGSGKSLTMVFMVRQMRQMGGFNDWKVVFVTDRTQLQKQLSETGQGIGQTVKVAEWITPRTGKDQEGKSLKELLATDTPDIVMAMIQKFQEQDLHEIFPKLNPSANILVMIDEAHRSIYKLLGANLDRALPGSARLAYTGTPIDKTEQTFGDYIDKYTMRQSIADGTTLGIVYEGRTHNAEVPDKKGMDVRFEDVFSEYNLLERLQILGYGSRDAYLEAEDVIREKARDMIDHYVAHVFPGGFKAQVVATSREAAVRYKTHLDAALAEKVAGLERHNPNGINLESLRTLETAVVISGMHNDRPHMRQFTNENYHETSIRRFKLPFDAEEREGETTIDGRVGIIVVMNMLITGFDAPIEQVMYLDRVIMDHNLLQAIARVNRVSGEHKEKGFVIDYVGIGHHLKRALDAYAEREQDEILESIASQDEPLNELAQAHREVWSLLEKYGLTDFSDPDAFFDIFYDEDTRFEYILAFNKLTRAMNLVMPRKEALDYWGDYQNFLAINHMASRHLQDQRLSMRGIPDKLRAIADEFLKSKGISQRIKPISILSPDFQKDVSERKRSKTRAAAVEHAIRHYIDVNIDEDPELFVSFAEELERILQEFKDNWDKVYEELEKLRRRITAKEQEYTYGLDRKRQMPIFRIFRVELFNNRELSEDEISQNVDLTQNTFNLIQREVQFAGFWRSIPAQNRLKAELQGLLLSEPYASIQNIFPRRQEIITRLMEWARENHATILRE
ncbi:MAG: type I restriction endonuclease subunit R [Anaerolineales bacterium]|nr:type I restriction endonuclease subunit R [Anaerolineales bacterium]